MNILDTSEGNMISMPLDEACERVATIWRESPDIPVNTCFDNLYALTLDDHTQQLPEELMPTEPNLGEIDSYEPDPDVPL